MYYDNERKEMCQFLPENYSKVLEIGCGEGEFRKNLTNPHVYWGVEPVSEVASVASSKVDKILTGIYQDVACDIPNNYFDLVICNDVIEHMSDHDQFLLSIKEKMSNNSFLIISVPNVRYFTNLCELIVCKEWRYRDQGILDNTHLRFFTPKSIVRSVVAGGFSIDLLKMTNLHQNKNLFKIALFSLGGFFLGNDVKFVNIAIRAKITS